MNIQTARAIECSLTLDIRAHLDNLFVFDDSLECETRYDGHHEERDILP